MANVADIAVLQRRALNPTLSSSLEGIWCCSTGFHTDGLVDEGVVPAVELPVTSRLVGVLGPLRRYRCTIHGEAVLFALA